MMCKKIFVQSPCNSTILTKKEELLMMQGLTCLGPVRSHLLAIIGLSHFLTQPLKDFSQKLEHIARARHWRRKPHSLTISTSPDPRRPPNPSMSCPIQPTPSVLATRVHATTQEWPRHHRGVYTDLHVIGGHNEAAIEAFLLFV